MSISITAALLADITADPEALQQLAVALAPHLPATTPGLARPTGLTTAQAANAAGLHERTIRRALAAGTLGGHTIAGRWRIDSDDLATWILAGAPTSSIPAHHNARPSRAATAGADAIAGKAA